MLRFRFFAVAFGLLGFALTGSAQSSFKLIANPSVSAGTVAADHVSQIFLKKTDKWPDGSGAVPVDQKVGSSVREAFSQAVHQRSAAAVDAYWQKRIFSGRGLPPLTKGSDAEVVAFVRDTPGAVGYVSSGASTEGVKTIAIR
jgi:ABC-type phosphate transport system substrate-binding protein